MTNQALAIIDTTATAVPLSKPEQKKLFQLEQQIELSKKKFFYDVGMALATINHERLYRETHDSFEAYVEEKHEFRRDRAYKLIRAVEVAENLNRLASGYPSPTAEFQVRELAEFTPEEQAAIWKEACDRAALEPGKAPPASMVQQIADERRAALDGADAGRKKSKAKKGAPTPETNDEDEDQDDEANEFTSDDLFTPELYAAAVRDVLGHIELDPASCDEANEVVQAERIFTIEEDGLAQEWDCETLYLNPPYSRGNVDRFVARVLEAYDNGEIRRGAVLCVNASTGTSWFPPLFKFPCCFVKGRIPFRKSKAMAEAMEAKAKAEGKTVPRNGNYDSVFVYLGRAPWDFVERFKEFGTIVTELNVPT